VLVHTRAEEKIKLNQIILPNSHLDRLLYPQQVVNKQHVHSPC
jgi:hypothetical protein